MLLKFAYQDFIDDRKFMNVSESHINNYHNILYKFIKYLTDERQVLNVEDITQQHVKQYLIEGQKNGNKPGTINTKLVKIRTFLNYCVESDYIKTNPANKVKTLRDDVRINVFTDEQIQQMLGFYRRLRTRDKQLYAYRDYMLIVTLLGTGIRRREIIGLKWDDIDFINHSMFVFGKNRTRESVPITEKLSKELLAYRHFCEQYFTNLGEYVFVTVRNKQMSPNAIAQVFKHLGQKMNFKDIRVSCHTFRHTFCHRLALSGMSAFAIQKLMRHKNISVTMKYVAMWGNELREQNDKYNPLNNLEV